MKHKTARRVLIAEFSESLTNVRFYNLNNAHETGCIPKAQDLVLLTSNDCFVYAIPIPKALCRSALIRSLILQYLQEQFPQDISLIQYSHQIIETSTQKQIILVVVFRELYNTLQAISPNLNISVLPLILYTRYHPNNTLYSVVLHNTVEECLFSEGILRYYSYYQLQKSTKQKRKIVLHTIEANNDLSGIEGIKLLSSTTMNVSITNELGLSYTSTDVVNTLNTGIMYRRELLFSPKRAIGSMYKMGAIVLLGGFSLIALAFYPYTARVLQSHKTLLHTLDAELQKVEEERQLSTQITKELQTLYTSNRNTYTTVLGEVLAHLDIDFTIDAIQFREHTVEMRFVTEHSLELFHTIKEVQYFTTLELVSITKQKDLEHITIVGRYND